MSFCVWVSAFVWLHTTQSLLLFLFSPDDVTRSARETIHSYIFGRQETEKHIIRMHDADTWEEQKKTEWIFGEEESQREKGGKHVTPYESTPQLGDLFDPLFKKGIHNRLCVHMFCLHDFVFVCLCMCFIVCIRMNCMSGLTVWKKRWNLCNKCLEKTAEKEGVKDIFFLLQRIV